MEKYEGSPKEVFKKKSIDFIFIVLLIIVAYIVIFLVIPYGIVDLYQDFKEYFLNASIWEQALIGIGAT